MSVIAAALRELISAGLAGEDLVLAIERIENAKVDAQAERRRAKDRERKRNVRKSLRTSAESADNPSPKDTTDSSEPTAPRSKPHPTPYSPPPFEHFWSAYPNKVGKRAADTAYRRALSRADQETILAGLERAKTSRQWADGFIPHPTTWLNQDRWLDEPDETARGPPMTGGMVAAASDEAGYRMALDRARERERGNHQRDQSVVVALPAPAARLG